MSRPPFASMYWTPAQQLAHLSVNGASLRTGDLYRLRYRVRPRPRRARLVPRAVLGRRPSRWNWPAASTRTFLEDGDTVTLRASAPGLHGSTIGFGPLTGTVLPARA
ncbi:MAG: hypothetical protein WKF47_05255 [Geodermatophilaceae bacterium]